MQARDFVPTLSLKRPPSAGARAQTGDPFRVLGGLSLDKPEDPREAAAMLRRLSGRTHEVWTGVHVLRPATLATAGTVERTRVRMRAFDEATIAWYVATGEPLDKAGAYGIQGLGVFLVDGIEGSWSNVVGLPLERLPDLFAAVGLRFPA